MVRYFDQVCSAVHLFGFRPQHQGIGEEIVNLAFGLVVGALAIAFALAYGLGGREAAGQHFADFLQRLKKDKK